MRLRYAPTGKDGLTQWWSTAAALARLERAVPQLRPSASKLRAFVDALPDGGVRASLEAAGCAASTLLLATAAECDDCSKARRCSKMSSAFGSALIARRRAYGRPTEPLF